MRWKNLLSTGNYFTEIKLDNNTNTLVVGENGSGKSTMLDALCFGLFGKAFRNVNKPNLLNSINGKECIVEIEFTIGKSNFRVKRGIKPAIFEIWRGDVMINQDSHAKEYQKILEQNIIKLNHKSFHQIVVLGSSSFIPFMQLNAQHRRDVIEDLLDINVFSKMNTLVKEKNAVLKEKLKDISHQLDLKKNQIDSQRKYIRDINAINEEEIDTKEIQITATEEEIDTLIAENVESAEYIEKESDRVDLALSEANNRKQSLLQYKAEFNTSIKAVVKDAKFYEDNSECPTCEQTIGDELRQSKLADAKSRAAELTNGIQKVEEEGSKVSATIEKFTTAAGVIRDRQQSINNNSIAIQRLQASIKSFNSDKM